MARICGGLKPTLALRAHHSNNDVLVLRDLHRALSAHSVTDKVRDLIKPINQQSALDDMKLVGRIFIEDAVKSRAILKLSLMRRMTEMAQKKPPVSTTTS